MAVLINWLLVNRCVLEHWLKAVVLQHSYMTAGKEFQMDGVVTLNARRARSVLVRGMDGHQWMTVVTVSACGFV